MMMNFEVKDRIKCTFNIYSQTGNIMTTGSAIILFFLRLLNAKKFFANQFTNPPRGAGNFKKEKFGSQFHTESWTVEGFDVITIKSSASQSHQHIIFFHGGAYAVEASAIHRQIVKAFVLKHGFTVTFIDYPKAPEHTFETTHRVILEAYQDVLMKNLSDEILFFGDSAGGGLALSFLQVLRDKKVIPLPTKTVLMSPWVDVTMGNKKISEYESKDPILTVEGLVAAGKRYAGSGDPKNPLISPIYGDLSGLGSIQVFAGTNEIFYPDCIYLAEKLEQAPGSSIELIVEPGMIHDWIIMPTSESKKAISQMVEFYRN